jgi:DNA repair exonuclease SbcCD ATPase subunit
LDRDEAKRDAKELAQELSDILSVKVDTDTDSLDDLAKEFNQQLTKMGKQQIVFSEKTLHGIVAQFANAISEGIMSGINVGGKINTGRVGDKIGDSIADGIVDGVTKGVDAEIKRLSAELDDLKKERTRLTTEANRIKGNAKYSKEFSKIADFDPATAKPLQVPKEIGQLKEMAAKIREEFEDAYYAIQDAEEQGAEAYMSAVLKAKEKHNQLWQMNEVLTSRKGNADLADEIKLYGETLFGEMSIGADFDGMFEEIHDGIEKSRTQLDDVKSALTGINRQIDDITNQIASLSNSTAMADQAEKTLKTFQEIEEAQRRIAEQDKKKGGKATEGIRDAVNYVPGDKPKFTVLKNAYLKSVQSGDNWEVQYQWLVKFVKEYDAYTKKIEETTNPVDRKNMRATQKKYEDLWKQLSPLAQGAEESLSQLLPEGEKKQATAGSTAGTSAEATERAAQAEREKRLEAEARMKAENEIEASLKRQNIEAEKLAKVEERKRELLLQNKAIIAEMLGMSNEVGLFFNSETGEISNPIEGKKHSVVTSLEEWKQAVVSQFDTRLHKHNYDVAAPSFSDKENDFDTWLKGFEHIKRQMILANKEILSFDFSSVSKETLRSIATWYTQAAKEIDAEFDGYINDRKVGEMFGTFDNMQEQMQVRLREALNNIMTQFPGVMTSYKLPDDMVKRAETKPVVEQDTKVDKRGVEILKVEADAHRDNAVSISEEAQAVEKLNAVKSEEPKSTLTDKYDQAPDEVKKKYQEIIALQDQIDELESKTQKLPIDMDPWNATKEQKDQIVAAWREYQKVIQEIAAMPIVETEDDEKRLLELKAKAVSLYETMHQGHLNDVLGDGYAKEYGLSIEDGKQMHLDMQDTPRKDFEKSLGGLQSKLNDAYLAAQKLDGEMYKMMLHADDDSIENLYEKIRQDALAAKPAVEALNNGIEETINATQNAGGIGTGDASSVELEAATKAEALQDEVEQKNKELVDKDAEIARVRAENEARLKTDADEKDRLQADLNATNQQLADVKRENELYDTALAKATEESNVKDGVIRELREQLANVKTGVSEEQASVSSEELKNVLSSIVYKVKIAHDDNDKAANKIAIDEGVLESTLKRVFTNVLNPHTEQNDSESKNEPWALEKTLQTVKGVLDNIQTNTTKSESVEVAPAKVEVGNVLATENTLAAIRTAVESINTKVVKGAKSTTDSNNQAPKQDAGGLTPYVADDDSDSTSAKNNDKSMKLLADISLQRKNLEKFVVQLQTAGKLTDEYQVWIDNLTTFLDNITSTDEMAIWKKAFARTKTSVGIDDVVGKAEDKETATTYKEIIEFQKVRNQLELDYAKAQDGSALKQFYAQQLAQMDQTIAKQRTIIENEEYEAKLAKIREEQRRKLGEAEAKIADKDAKAQATEDKRQAKRNAMFGKAGNAIGRAENLWMNAQGEDDPLPPQLIAQIDELYDKMVALRAEQDKVRTAEYVTDEQQTDLRNHTIEMNALTNEVSELFAEYQKLSGKNVEQIGVNSLNKDAGLDAYKAQLQQAILAKYPNAQIKGFDAATKTLTYTLKTGAHEFTEYTAAVRRADGALVAVQGTTKRTETFFEATARKMKELTSYFSGMAIFNRVGQELRRGIQYVREIDLALTELKKVTNETEETYDKFLDTAAKTGARLGTTISAVTEATATFSKLGYSMEQATEMAEAAIVYKNVGDNIASTEDAADSIISTMKGFRLEASESMAIVDRFNEVGNRFAITSQGIGEALRLSASALSEGGNSLDESIALITAANEVVNDPSSVGTALKTLTLRLRGSKTELEEMGEDVSNMATTTSQLQAKLLALTGGQVDIMLDEN